MRKTTAVLILAIGAATLGIGAAPLAGADTSSDCQTVGGATICGQGGVRGSGGGAPGGASVPASPPGGACTNAYGGYQNCNIH